MFLSHPFCENLELQTIFIFKYDIIFLASLRKFLDPARGVRIIQSERTPWFLSKGTFLFRVFLLSFAQPFILCSDHLLRQTHTNVRTVPQLKCPEDRFKFLWSPYAMCILCKLWWCWYCACIYICLWMHSNISTTRMRMMMVVKETTEYFSPTWSPNELVGFWWRPVALMPCV